MLKINQKWKFQIILIKYKVKIFGLLILFFTSIFFINFKNENEILGHYVSIKHNRNDKITIMYFKGYFNFLYVRENERELDILKNGNYIYKYSTCNNGKIISQGKWKLEKNKLKLIDGNPNIEFIVKGNKIYNISFVKRISDNKKIPSLCLMKKSVYNKK